MLLKFLGAAGTHCRLGGAVAVAAPTDYVAVGAFVDTRRSYMMAAINLGLTLPARLLMLLQVFLRFCLCLGMWMC